MRGSRWIALLAVGALTLAGCGGDDDDGDAAPSVEEGDDDAAEAGDDDSDDDSGDDSGDDDSGGDDIDIPEGAFTSEDCADAYQAVIAASAAAAAAFTGQGGEDLDSALAELEGFLDDAPDDIQDDLETWYEGYAEYVSALQDAGFDAEGGVPDADALQELTELSESLNTEEFQAAGERLGEWLQTECGVEE